MLAFGLALFLLADFCLGNTQLPIFTWVEDVAPFSGVPLLRIQFPDGGKDDFALLRSFNPVPLGPSERIENVDSCIFQGYLLNEKDVHVTLTGCPLSDTFQVQFDSSRLSHDMFKVTSGVVQGIVHNLSGLDFDIKSGGDDGPIIEREDIMPLSKNGYILRMKAFYDQRFYDKFGDDAPNAIRRLIAHTQHVYKWPSLTTKVIIQVEPEMVFVPNENWNAQNSLGDACEKHSIDYKTTHINTNVFFAVRDFSLGFSTIGRADQGGACARAKSDHCAIMEYEHDDITFARSLAHELGHNLGMKHDFLGKGTDYYQIPANIRRDSKQVACSGIGSVMDYDKYVDGAKRTWSTCSVEDLSKLISANKDCIKEIDPKNPPTEVVSPPLTPTECDLTRQKPGNGYYHTSYNGFSCLALCIDGICVPSRNCGSSSNPACLNICGKESCKDAVEPPSCDLKLKLQDFSGIQDLNLNGYYTSVFCRKGLCWPKIRSFEDSCLSICGEKNCLKAVEPTQCYMPLLPEGSSNVKVNGVKTNVICSQGFCKPEKSAEDIGGGYQSSCIKICGADDCSKINKY